MPILPRITAWLTTIVLLGAAGLAGHPPDAPPAHVQAAFQPSEGTWAPESLAEVVWAHTEALREAEEVEAARMAEEARQEAEKAAQEARRPAPTTTPRPPVVWNGTIHSHPWMVCTRQHESDRGDANGNGLHDAGYQAYNASGPYLGAYQFLQSTWNSTAAMAGRGDLVGVDPREASVADQDEMAWTLSNGGVNKGPWGGRC